jgi:outer membrane lipoprotein-sorting protein
MRKTRPMMNRLAPLAGGLILSAAWFGPAAAQNPLDFLFGRSPQTAPAQPAAPAKAPAASPAPAGKPGTAMVPPKRPASLPEEAGAPAPAAQAPAKPPSAPAQAAAPAVATAAAPTAVASSTAAAKPLADKEIIERANAYFNAISSLVGDFVQIGGEGRRLTGKLYLQRPGKIRFEYDAPATLEVIADGSSVAVRDRKLATQDLYSIGQTPLKFLLRDRIELGRDLAITEVANENDGVRVSVEDRSTLGGTSKITLYFDKDVANLNRWRIIDPQGFQTTVSLANLERNRRIEQQLFTINYERIQNDR